MIAKLHIKGDKEPIELELLEGKAADTFMADKTVPNDARFVIEGVVNVLKSDMRYVKFEKQSFYPSDRKDAKKEMTDAEFATMKEEMFQAETDAVKAGFPKYHWKDFWMQTKKVIRLEMLLDWKNEKYYRRLVTTGISYINRQDEMSLFEDRMSKIEYAKKKEMEHLEKVAEQSEIKS